MTTEYGSTAIESTSPLRDSHHHESHQSNRAWPRARSLSRIPEEKSQRFETSLVTSVFSGRGLGTGGQSVDQPPLSTFTRRQLTSLACIAYGNFWVAACVSLQAPFFPHEAEKKGASSTIYGLVFGVYELMIIIMSPVFGRFVTVTSPNFLVEAGLFVCGSSTVIFGWVAACASRNFYIDFFLNRVLDKVPSGSPFIAYAFIVRILEGIGAASFLTASYTLMAREFPDRVGTTFALLETAFGLGLILGPTVGGALYQFGGYYMPFVILGTFLLLGGLLSYLALPLVVEKPTNRSASFWKFLADKSTIIDALATATSLNFIGFNAATFEPHIRQFHLTPIITGSLFVLTGAIYALTSPIMGRICESGFNAKSLCLIGCVLVFSGSLFIGPLPIIPFEPQLWLIITSLLVIGLGLSAKLVSSFVGAVNHSITNRGYPNDSSTYGLVSALFFSSCSVGAFIGPSAGGYLLDHFGYRSATIFIVTADFLMIILLTATAFSKRSKPRNYSIVG